MGVMRSLLPLLPMLGLVMVSASASAQSGPVPPPPGAATPQTLDPVEREPLIGSVGGGRLRLSLGGQALLLDGDRADGFDQLERIGVAKPRMALRVNLEGRWHLGEVVRLGIAGGLDWTRNTEDEDDVPVDAEARRSALRTSYLEGVLVLGVTRMGSPTTTIDLGLRLAGGGGLSSWVWNGEPELAGHYRLSAAFDVAFLFGYASANGVGLRIGWQHVRSGPFGPLDLHFDLSGPFLDIGFVHGW